jgi:cell division protease FtsH
MPAREPTPPNSTKPPRRPPLSPTLPGGWIWLLILAGVLILFFASPLWPKSESVPYGVFKDQLLRHDNVTNVKISTSSITGEFKDAKPLPEDIAKRSSLKFTTLKPIIDDNELIKQLDERKVQYDFEKDWTWIAPLLAYSLLPMLLLLAVFFFVLLPRLRDPMGGGFLTNYIKSPAKRYEKNKGRTTFEDVADMENAKRELQEVVDYLRSPEKFQRLGGQIPKGVLLVGPPGTGKTLLARAVAGEAGVPFYSISGSEFIQMFVGVGASRVRDLFKTARENSPCILFVDEIDAVGRVRGAGLGGGHDEREQTLNQILSEMDGFLPTESVIVIAATNRPDVLDPALLRPGRFDRHVAIDRPTWQGRMAILKVHTRDKPLAPDVNLEMIARAMIGMTGADLRNLANEAALLAVRDGKNKLDRRDFERAADRVLIGAKREEVLTAEDKRKTAYHEAGHALTAWLEPAADRPLKVSIIPRGQTLGVNVNIPEEERFHHGQDYFLARLVVMLGGRAADRLIYGQTYAGAESDLKQATRIARLMVTHWGMSHRLGPVAYRVGEEHVFLGKEIQEPRDFSEGTAQLIDEEVRRLLQEADERAIRHLEEHRAELERLVEALLQREELSRDEIDQLMRNGKLDEPTNHEAATADAPLAEARG